MHKATHAHTHKTKYCFNYTDGYVIKRFAPEYGNTLTLPGYTPHQDGKTKVFKKSYKKSHIGAFGVCMLFSF